MGRILNFLGGAARSLQGSIDQDRLEQKRIEDDERQFAKQVSWAKAAEAIRANMQTKTAIPTPSPFGAPIQDANGNWVQPTKTPVGALLDEQTGDVVRPAALEDGPAVPVPAPIRKFKDSERTVGDEKVTFRVYEDGSEEELSRGGRYRQGGGGSSSAKVRTVTNSDGSKTDYDPNTGAELKHYPAKGGGGTKPADQDKVRESYMKDREFIRGAQTVDELATYLTSIGAKVPARDSQEVLNAPVNQEDDHYLGVLRDVAAKAADARVSGKVKQDKPDEASAAQLKPPPQDVLSQAKNAVKNGASAESVRERLRKNGYSDEGI